LFVAAPGNVLVAADFSSMELRAAAEISGDAAMRNAFERGDDLHRLTAAMVIGKKPEEVTAEERSSAKRVNFGAAYGSGARGLIKSAWDSYGVVLTPAEAENWLSGFSTAFPTFAKWRRTHADKCEAARRIVIGRDAAAGIGRVFELSWLNPEQSPYTVACNLPIQGACADASMLALAAIDRLLCEEGIDGGPVAWLHDEIVLEVPIEEAMRAAELLQQAMVKAFAETFRNAPLNGLVHVHTGTTWASLKT
jgi:DNA polymerase-1